MIKVLGIDPGNYKTGFSIFLKKKPEPVLINSGTIKPPKKKPENFKFIFETLKEILEKEKPSEIALESSFYGKNPQTIIKLGEIRGVILLLSALYNVPVYEYTPQQVKNAITGYGWSKKEDVSFMVEKLFGKKPETFDEADAIAVGFCHCLNSV
ncbi:MAG: crossover junction endodeoxyribonuclease RuvC [Aquificota bacterium]|nr:MAG: crossover junction endodeoxyribonuclease RuvC [Aquificota bacterium]